MYETSTEVMKLNEGWNKKIDFRDVIGKMIDPNSESKGDTGDASAQEKVTDLVPRLNEIFIEIVME